VLPISWIVVGAVHGALFLGFAQDSSRAAAP
jgi:hypothetical protein